MRLTRKLFGYLYRAFRAGPGAFPVMTVAYNGAMTWRVVDSVFATDVVGGNGKNLSIDLSSKTLEELRLAIEARPGYSVPSWDTRVTGLSACVLLDEEGAQKVGGVATLRAYSTIEWAFLDAAASVLHAARESVIAMPREMVLHSASGWWLDYLGSHYKVDRNDGEPDQDYATRILYTVLAPKSNNVSIAEAIYHATGRRYKVDVVDAPLTARPRYNVRNGSIRYDGRELHGPTVTRFYGEFDVLTPIDLVEEPDIDRAVRRITRIANATRAAGTRLREVQTTSALQDQVFRQDDRLSVVVGTDFTDSPYRHTYDGSIPRDGSVRRSGSNDRMSLSAIVSVDETDIAPFLYGDGVQRDGSQRRGGRRTAAADSIGLTILANVRHNGAWPRDGTIKYRGQMAIQETL